MYLADNEDETEIAILQSPNASTIKTIMGTGQAVRSHNFEYQERTLDIDQFKGLHTFLDHGGIGFDWQKLDHAQWQAQTHDEPLDAMLTESGLLS